MRPRSSTGRRRVPGSGSDGAGRRRRGRRRDRGRRGRGDRGSRSRSGSASARSRRSGRGGRGRGRASASGSAPERSRGRSAATTYRRYPDVPVPVLSRCPSGPVASTVSPLCTERPARASGVITTRTGPLPSSIVIAVPSDSASTLPDIESGDAQPLPLERLGAQRRSRRPPRRAGPAARSLRCRTRRPAGPAGRIAEPDFATQEDLGAGRDRRDDACVEIDGDAAAGVLDERGPAVLERTEIRRERCRRSWPSPRRAAREPSEIGMTWSAVGAGVGVGVGATVGAGVGAGVGVGVGAASASGSSSGSASVSAGRGSVSASVPTSGPGSVVGVGSRRRRDRSRCRVGVARRHGGRRGSARSRDRRRR